MEKADGMRRWPGNLRCGTTAPRRGDVWLGKVSGFALKMRGPHLLSTPHLQASLRMFPVFPLPAAPQLQVSCTPRLPPAFREPPRCPPSALCCSQLGPPDPPHWGSCSSGWSPLHLHLPEPGRYLSRSALLLGKHSLP